MERREELEDILIGLMNELDISAVRMMVTLALIRSYQIHEKMIEWIAGYHNSDHVMTAQDFLSKVRELSEGRNKSHPVRFGGYYNHPDRYEKYKSVNPKGCEEDDGKD